MRTYKYSKETRRKMSEASKRFWAERRKNNPPKPKKMKTIILKSVTGGDIKGYLKAIKCLAQRGPLSEDAHESLRIIEKLEPKIFEKYYVK